MTFRIAIVGAGYMAAEHAKAFASIPDVKIVGVTSRTKARAEALAAEYGAVAYSNIASMYAATNADAVIVAVPELSCHSVCEQIFAFPWLSLIEKPVGHDLATAEEILRMSESNDREVYVALNRRSYAASRNAIDMLGDDGPRFVQVNDTQDLDEASRFGQPPEVVANWMFANSIHLVDYFPYFARGSLVDVAVTVPWDPASPNAVVATLTYDSGDTGLYVAQWNRAGPWFVSVTNDAIRAELRPLESLAVQKRGERKLGTVAADPDDTAFKPGLRHQAQQLVNRLAGKGFRLATLSDATNSMRLVARIYGSHG